MGQAGSSSTEANDVLQICFEERSVRTPLKAFVVQDTFSKSRGWSSEKIWVTGDVSTNPGRATGHAPHT